MKKIIIGIYFFCNFPVAGNENNNNNNNNEKKIAAEIWMGYCPNRIVREGFVL